MTETGLDAAGAPLGHGRRGAARRGHATESARVRLGSSTYTPAHVLSELAKDPAVTVRAAVAMNPACPPHVDAAIGQDPDERVRALLARKLAHLLPSLTQDERRQASHQVMTTLAVLVSDAAVRVRAALAECVKAMPDAPRALILQLANDTAIAVCDPVIRLSPLLTDTDLLGLLTAPPHPGAPTSVASRMRLSAPVADAVAASADSAAIRALLSNHSASIREATLDRLIERAAPHEDWHAPLASRPGLSARAARALREFVAADLLAELAQRAELGAEMLAEMQRGVAARLDPAAETPCPGWEMDELVASLRRLDTEGALTEAAMLDAARAGDHPRVAAMLAVACSLPIASVERAGALRNAKALTSLVWRAGFSMRAAGVVQAMLGNLGPDAIMQPGADGAFPLSEDEMRWQLEVLSQPIR